MNPFSIRINTLKISVQEFKKKLEELSILYSEVSWYESALIIKDFDKHSLMETDLYEKGLFYIQNLSSMIPVLILDPQPGEQILDLCAAPGGKTIQMSAHMKNSGEITANDVSQNRIYKTDRLLKHYGVENVRLTRGKGEFLWRKYSNTFDRVLVDAPCSMAEHMSSKELKMLGRRQQYLLRSACACTLPGGRIVYSTCTITSEENENVLGWIQKKEEGIIIEKINPPEELQQFVTEEGAVKIKGSDLFEPFFVALLKKNENI